MYLSMLRLLMLMTAASNFARAQERPYTVTDGEVNAVLERIESQTTAFRAEVRRTMGRMISDGNKDAGAITPMVASFEKATNKLKSNFASHHSTASDVRTVLDKAVVVTGFVRNNRMSMKANDIWDSVRDDLNILAGYYGVSLKPNSNAEPDGDQAGNTLSGEQMQTLLDKLKQRTDAFRQSYQRWSDQFDRPMNPDAPYDISRPLTAFETALDNLIKDQTAGKVEDLLRPATGINEFAASGQPDKDVIDKWVLVRADLDVLAQHYGVKWNWDDPAN